MKKEKIIPIILLIVGIVWVVLGFGSYKFLVDGAPGIGFFPVIAGGMLTLLAAGIVFLPSEAEKENAALKIRSFFPTVSGIFVILGSYLVGTIFSVGILVVVWMLLIEKAKPLLAITTSIATTAAVYFVFSYWLTVPFPKGLLNLI